MSRTEYFLKKYAGSWCEYIFLNSFWVLIKYIPSPFGIAIRSFFLNIIGLASGLVSCETGVEIRNFRNIQIGSGSFIESLSEINGLNGFISIGSGAYIGRGTVINCYNFKKKSGSLIKIGKNFYCGEFTNIRGQGPVEIGNDVLFSPFVGVFPVNHKINSGPVPRNKQKIDAYGIKIGNNVWVGASSVVIDKSVVGNNSIIAAGSVVSGIVEESSLYGGSPAKFIKRLVQSN